VPSGALHDYEDSAGVRVLYKSIQSLCSGDTIAGGWRPWLVFERNEHDEERGYRMVFVDGHKGEWVEDELTPVPVVVFDPKEGDDDSP
jgi:hypothetical protein